MPSSLTTEEREFITRIGQWANEENNAQSLMWALGWDIALGYSDLTKYGKRNNVVGEAPPDKRASLEKVVKACMKICVFNGGKKPNKAVRERIEKNAPTRVGSVYNRLNKDILTSKGKDYRDCLKPAVKRKPKNDKPDLDGGIKPTQEAIAQAMAIVLGNADPKDHDSIINEITSKAFANLAKA